MNESLLEITESLVAIADEPEGDGFAPSIPVSSVKLEGTLEERQSLVGTFLGVEVSCPGQDLLRGFVGWGGGRLTWRFVIGWGVRGGAGERANEDRRSRRSPPDHPLPPGPG